MLRIKRLASSAPATTTPGNVAITVARSSDIFVNGNGNKNENYLQNENEIETIINDTKTK